jgi:plastocyanin
VADQDEHEGMPRWVKVMGAIGIVVLAIAAGVLVFGGSQHGPGRHMGGGTHASPTTGNNSSMSTHANASHAASGAHEIQVTASNFAFDPKEITVTAGTDVVIALTASDARHDFVIDELGAHVVAEKGQTATGGFNAGSPGRYTFYCTEPGHREAGMQGTLVVQNHHG